MTRYLMNTFAGVDNKEFFEYSERLERHVRELSNPIKKRYRFGMGTIETTETDLLDNPNGRNKWNGWVKIGKTYSIVVYNNGELVQAGTFYDKDTANDWFLDMKKLCKSFEEEVYFK